MVGERHDLLASTVHEWIRIDKQRVRSLSGQGPKGSISFGGHVERSDLQTQGARGGLHGLVASLNRPGGNVTGIFFNTGADLESKQLELLREALPHAAVIGVLVHSKSPQSESDIKNAQAAAQALGMSALILNVSSENDFEAAFAALAQQRADALLITGYAFFTGHVDRLAALTVRQGIAAVHGLREFAAAGGLMSYGASITKAYQQAGVYAGKILKSTKPADLPIMQPTKFELVINAKTAKTLGLKLPDRVLALAEEVIE